MRQARICILDRDDRIGIATHDKNRLPNKSQERQAAPPCSRCELIPVTQARTPDLAVPEQPPNLVTMPADVPRVQQARGVVRPPVTFRSQHFHHHLRPTRDRHSNPGLVRINTNRRHRPRY